jgi:hypothetical protein
MSQPSPAPGRRSRAWSVTGGRVQPPGNVRLDTLVTAVPGRDGPLPPGSDYPRILHLARSAVAVAEIASALGAPVGVAAVMVGELHDRGWVETKAPLDMASNDDVVTVALLERMVERLRAI